MLTNIQSKRLQSIIIIVIIAITGVAGLLFLMSWLATPDNPTAKSIEATQQPRAVDVPATPPRNKAIGSNDDDDIAATVNNHVISKQDWDKATQLDMVMNRLAGQPPTTAEQTLDQLINEIIVLAESTEFYSPTAEEIETRTMAFEEAWRVPDDEVEAALEGAGLTRTDLITRVSRLIQVQTALNQMADQQDNLDDWLLAARASAEIGLYQPLAGKPIPPSTALEQQISITQTQPEAEPAADVQTFAPPPDMPVAPYKDNAAPDFVLTQLNGEPLTLSNFRGKPTIVNFWASWCPPCRRELPALQNAYTTYGDKIGFIAVDVKEDTGTVTAFVEDMNLSFPIVLDPNGEISNVMYEVRGIPTTIFVDANGIVAARHVGPLDAATIDEYLAPLLKQTGQITSTDNSGQTSSALTMITGEGITATTDEGVPSSNPMPTGDLILAPGFTTTSGQGDTITLQDYQDESNVVLVFYRGNT